MLIKDLPNSIYIRALKYTTKTDRQVQTAFRWSDTEEGSPYWYAVQMYRLDEAYKIYPNPKHNTSCKLCATIEAYKKCGSPKLENFLSKYKISKYNNTILHAGKRCIYCPICQTFIP